MILGLGGLKAPPIGRTTDDLKLDNFWNLAVSAVQGFQESQFPRKVRELTRGSLDPIEVQEERRQKVRGPAVISEGGFQFTPSLTIPIGEVGRTFSVKEANEYNAEIGLTYDTIQSQAQLDWDRKNFERQIRRRDEMAAIEDGFLPKAISFVGLLGGAMADPTNLALVLIPPAAEVRLAMALKQAGTTGKVVLASRTSKLALGAAEGMAFGALTEIPNYMSAKNLQEEYSMQTLIFSTLAAGTLNGILQIPTSRRVKAKVESFNLDVDVRAKLKKEKGLLEIELESQRLIDKAVREGAKIEPFGGLGGVAPGRPTKGSSFTFSPRDFIPPEQTNRAFFLAAAQRGLDTDLYFMVRDSEEAFRKNLDDFILKKQKEVPSPKVKKGKLPTLEEGNLIRNQARRLINKRDAELTEGIAGALEEGGIPLRLTEVDELDFSPNVNAAREIEVTMDSALASSKALDEIGIKAGYPEVQQLDRTKHLMKSLEMRVAASRIALGDVLEGRPVNVEFLMREAVALDMFNRELLSELEYKNMLLDIVKDHKKYVEAPHGGVFTGEDISVSDKAFEAQRLSEKEQLAKHTDDIDALESQLEIDIKNLSDDVEQYDAFKQAKKEFEEAGRLEASYKGENITKAMRNLANCMAGGRK